LVGQKEAAINRLQTESAKLREKLDKALEKLYMPSGDRIIGGLTSDGHAHNVIKGVQQGFEVSTTLDPIKNLQIGSTSAIGEDQSEENSPQRGFGNSAGAH
jgi:hypothetical protein